MARRLVRKGGNEAEVMGFYDRAGRWNFRNPRTGHWMQGDEGSRARGARTYGQTGGPTDEDLKRGRRFKMRFQVRGQEYYQQTYVPGGFGPDFSGSDLLDIEAERDDEDIARYVA